MNLKSSPSLFKGLGLYWGNIGIMDKNMDTATITGLYGV